MLQPATQFFRASLIGVTLLLSQAAFILLSAGPELVEIKAIRAPGVENLFRLNDRLYSGAAPEGAGAFEALKKLGITTIISVDGSKPAVEAAHAAGMRYIHLPHGYDGISDHRQVELIRAAQTCTGGILMHCHHGKHRGPAAAAIVMMGTGHWTTNQALVWLGKAGTDPSYQGLFATVATFQPPSSMDLSRVSTNFAEIAPTVGLVDTMVAMDERWDRLRSFQKSGSQPQSPGTPRVLANEATLLREHLREAQRLPETTAQGAEFQEKLRDCEARAARLAEAFRVGLTETNAGAAKALHDAIKSLGESCVACHRAFRDPPKRPPAP